MKLEYIISIWLIIIAIFISLMSSGYIFKTPKLDSVIEINYINGSVQFIIYDKDLVIYSINIHPGGYNFNSTNINLDSCPTAVVLNTNKGYYKIFDIKC